jgi:PleD family two-component response regulator
MVIGSALFLLASQQQKLVQEAMQKGADAILIKNFHTIQTGFSTVENKIQEKKKSGKKSSTTVSTTQMEQAHVVTGELLKYR